MQIRAVRLPGQFDLVAYVFRGESGKDIDLGAITSARLIFEGTARKAAAGFPANLNVTPALALAGVGADRTQVQFRPDPTLREPPAVRRRQVKIKPVISNDPWPH
jgi:predicted dinucleotide-utilizing enzyme